MTIKKKGWGIKKGSYPSCGPYDSSYKQQDKEKQKKIFRKIK